MRAVLDCETGGLDYTKHALIQVAILIPDKDAHINLHIRPFRGAKFSVEASKVNGFTKEDVLNDKTRLNEGEAAIKLERFIKKHFGSNKAKIIAHNSQFDYEFVRAWLDRTKKIVKFSDLFEKNWSCTQKLFTELRDEGLINCPSVRLIDLSKYFGISLENAHDALADITATAELHKIYLDFIHSGDKSLLRPLEKV